MLRFDERVHLPKNRENTITFLVNGEPIGTVETLAPGAKTVDIPIPPVDYDSVTDALGYVPVDKAGDTMTGALTIANDEYDKLALKHTVQEVGVTPSANQGNSLVFQDKKGTVVGYVQNVYKTDGGRYNRIGTRKGDGTGLASIEVGFTTGGTAYCTFPNTKCVDGQWVYKNTSLGSGVTWNTSSHKNAKNYSLSSYLPDDGQKYEVIVRAQGTTTSTSGKFIAISIYSDILTASIYVCRCKTRSSSSVNCSGNIIIPVGTGRKITVAGAGSEASADGTYDIACMGYRRIGTNS